MKAPSLYFAGLLGLFVLSACTVPQKTTEAETSNKKSTPELAEPAPAGSSMTVVPCRFPNQKNCK
jgi:hypothetical protein